jgi:folate-binding protein YgfZ
VIDLETGQGAPTVLTTDRGRILDVIGVINMGGHILMTTSPGLQQPVIDWLDKYTIMEDLTVEDITADTAMLAVLGPDSATALEAATGGRDLADLAPFHALQAGIGGLPVTLINQPLGALPGFALVMAAKDATQVWERLTALGACPTGIDAYEAVRVQYGVPVHGPEMGEPYNPLEAGLIGSIDFAKGCYIGQEVIARLDTYQKVQKRLVSLRFSPDAAPSMGVELHDEGKKVGTVTSAVTLPTTEETIGLGYVRTGSARVGVRLELAESEGAWAEVLDLPELFGPEKS